MNLSTRRQRETIVLVFLTLAVVGGSFLFFLLVGGITFLSMLAVLGAMFLLGLVHYWLWGRDFDQQNRDRDFNQ